MCITNRRLKNREPDWTKEEVREFLENPKRRAKTVSEEPKKSILPKSSLKVDDGKIEILSEDGNYE